MSRQPKRVALKDAVGARFATIKWQPFDSYSLCPELRMRTSAKARRRAAAVARATLQTFSRIYEETFAELLAGRQRLGAAV
jgi:hypothetical protein